ncbi:TPA: restriction endonuclease subunit S [Streptococcus suis]
MSEWKTIGEIAEIYDGPHATPKKIENGYYFLSISSLSNGNLDLSKSAKICEEDYKKWTKRIVPIEGDLLFSYETRLGEAALMPANLQACLGRRMGLLRPNLNFVRSDFLLFAWLSPEFQKVIKKNTITGATVERIALSELSDFPILLPSLFEQEKIVKILTKLDQKIALNNQINEELEAMAKTLYDYWFVQFDFPDENGKPYKSSGGKMVYNDQLKREIPEGWGVKCLGELDIATGKRDANFGTENGQYDFWTTANEPMKADEYSFEGKAILIAGNGNFYINFTEGKFEAYQRTYVIQSADENELLFMYPACLQSIEKLRKGSNGSIIKYITIGDVQNISQAHCPVIANLFVDIFRPIMNTIQKNKQQNQELTQLRDWLLPMLMNGQVMVEDKT